MKRSDFYYDLPQHLIAQHPMEQRDRSRLLCVDRATGDVQHRHFFDLPSLLRPGDCLILNNTKVLPARLYGVKEDTGAKVEFLLLNDRGDNTWESIAGPGKKAKEGSVFSFGNGRMKGEVTSVLPDGNRLVKFTCEGNFFAVLDEIGQMPLPPYITEKLSDPSRYQTVYSDKLGSAAAPTAGLHFTKDLLRQVEEKGVRIGYVTLHVGLGTFRPVKADDITQHTMHSEFYLLPQETADLINETRQNGGRVIAVGTTSCRTLEAVATERGCIEAASGSTDIFIYPGYQFKCIDGLITNFHLPESTLIMLVSAFCGYENTMRFYKIAVEEEYRFFSFGDACFIV